MINQLPYRIINRYNNMSNIQLQDFHGFFLQGAVPFQPTEGGGEIYKA